MLGTTVVAGPPGAGKTTYVLQHMTPGDLVVDVDALFRALTLISRRPKPNESHARVMPFVLDARDAIILRLASARTPPRHAWVITSQSHRETVEGLAARLRADLVILDTPVVECLKRINADPERVGQAEAWAPLIARWWTEWMGHAKD